MAAANPSLALFDSPDQEQVIADLTTFFGPKAERFLALYEKMRQKPAKKRLSVSSWNWGVFLLSFVWFFYRKQYLFGAVVLLTPIVLGLLLGNIGSASAVVFAIYANTWYVQNGLKRIVKADSLGLTGSERADYLRRAGGTSKIGGGIAAFIYISFISLAILGVIYAQSPGAAG